MISSTDASPTITVESGESIVVVDWGTSSFRLWSLSRTGEIIGRSNGPYGMASLAQTDYLKILVEHLNELSIAANSPVVICGMAGAAQGWYEAPYMPITANLSSIGRFAVRVPALKREVYILPGVKQAKPSNVMRGEETQILGLLATRPDFNGVVCMPGTHVKWVQISDGYIKRFSTCMTGELFALLSEHSVLKHSISQDGWDEIAFKAAVNEVIDSPSCVAENFFSLRAASLLDNQSPETARAKLSGMLVGLELSAMRDFWENESIALVGEQSLCQSYANALASQQIQSQCLDAEAMTLLGLVSAYKQIRGAEHDA